jgi:hypothetical protein
MSSLRDAISEPIWAARDRLAVGFGPTVRAIADAVKWPFERAAFAVQRSLIWPLEDRAGSANRPTRAVAFAAVVLLAAGVGVAGLLWAAPDGPNKPGTTSVATETAQPLAAVKPAPEKPAGPTLHGAAPDFKAAAAEPSSGADAVKSPTEATTSTSSSASSSATTSSSAAATEKASSSSAPKASTAPGPPAGPEAISVARNFSSAFVRYETGHSDITVRKAFDASASPELSRSLLRRPPRLPANVTVPKAKVVNIVAAPSHGRVYPVSVSLLRVGVTSELRLEMEQLQDKSWQVTNVLG